MVFSERKLRELANLPENIQTNQIIDAINSIGFEVENVEMFNKNSGLKFGYVLNTEKNPNSNKLTVCTIQFHDKNRIIQTAATNVKKGDYLIAFVPGSKLNGNEIKEKELAKITSYGMLASLEELGFNSNNLRNEWKEEILIIDQVDLNLDPIEFFQLNDNLIEVSILSNRSDAQCYFILAKELCAYFNTKMNFQINNKKSSFLSKIELKNSLNSKLNGFEVKLENELKLNWHQIMLLLKSNIKLYNEFDDYSSYVMIFTGIYPRIIDLDKIKSKNFFLEESNNLVNLKNDDEIISILGTNILDKYQPKQNSRNLFFEISQIDTKIVRDNSRNSKIINQSTINSSKKISLGSLIMTYDFITNNFTHFSNLINEINNENPKIKFDKDYLNKFAGFDITKDENYQRTINALKILDFIINDDYILVPLYRHDVQTMQDIVEEIFRFYGLNNFKPQQPNIKTTILNKQNIIEEKISLLGYTQAWTYTLINKEKNREFNPFNFQNEFNLLTFISEEFNSIRNSMALSLFNIYEYNFKRKINELSLFDIGMINDKKALMISSNTKTFQDIKNDIEKITNQRFVIKKSNYNQLHPHYNAALYLSGKQVGWIGKFNPFWIDSDIIFAEVFLDVIYYPNNIFHEYDSEPLKERDVTISINNTLSPIYYLNEIEKLGEIYSIKLISKFKKDNNINWTYKIKMPEKTSDVFDKNINNILKTKIEIIE